MYFGFDRISICYGKKQILTDISMDFKRGSITTILGPNASGKSSLLKTVSRTLQPASGDIVLENRSLSSYSPRELSRRIAYLPQLHPRLRDMDVRTLVSCGRYPYRRFGKNRSMDDMRIVDEALEKTCMTQHASCMLNSLSGGEKQRAWIAMCLCQQPEILIMDEPTTHLDISYQLEILELTARLRREMGITVVMVLHDLNLAARFSDSLYVLKDQKVFAEGTPEAVLQPEILRSVFDVGAQILSDEKNNCPYVIPE